MAFVSMERILKEARQARRAVGGFMFWDYDSASAILQAAQKLSQPVILIMGEGEAEYLGGFKNVFDIANAAARGIDVPVVLHADHFRDYANIVNAIRAGYSSVMIDASRFPIAENIRLTREVVRVAHAAGVSVEAELGRLPGNEGDEEVTFGEAFQTDPDEAAYFVEQTDIDALAVSIGTMHGAYPASFTPQINIPRVRQIAEKVALPLVMHGGSGTPSDKIAEAIHWGIAKINVATDVVTVSAKKIAEVQGQQGFRYNVANVYKVSKQACQEFVEERIRLFGGIA